MPKLCLTCFSMPDLCYTAVGKIELEIENVTSAQIESELYFVEKGGHWKPNQCMAKRKVS